jgi:hypothetical protein
MITAHLIERGQQRGLFEDEGDASLRRSAAGDPDNEAYDAREELVRQINDAITLRNHREARKLHEELMEMDGYDMSQEPEGREGKKSREFGLRQGVGGGGGTASRECLHWLNRLRGGARPVMESRKATKVDDWLRRLRS